MNPQTAYLVLSTALEAADLLIRNSNALIEKPSPDFIAKRDELRKIQVDLANEMSADPQAGEASVSSTSTEETDSTGTTTTAESPAELPDGAESAQDVSDVAAAEEPPKA